MIFPICIGQFGVFFSHQLVKIKYRHCTTADKMDKDYRLIFAAQFANFAYFMVLIDDCLIVAQVNH